MLENDTPPPQITQDEQRKKEKDIMYLDNLRVDHKGREFIFTTSK